MTVNSKDMRIKQRFFMFWKLWQFFVITVTLFFYFFFIQDSHNTQVCSPWVDHQLYSLLDILS